MELPNAHGCGKCLMHSLMQLVKMVESATALFGASAVLLKIYVLQLQHLAVVMSATELSSTWHVCLSQLQQPTLIKHSLPKTVISAYNSRHCILKLAVTMPQTCVNHCL